MWPHACADRFRIDCRCGVQIRHIDVSHSQMLHGPARPQCRVVHRSTADVAHTTKFQSEHRQPHRHDDRRRSTSVVASDSSPSVPRSVLVLLVSFLQASPTPNSSRKWVPMKNASSPKQEREKSEGVDFVRSGVCCTPSLPKNTGKVFLFFEKQCKKTQKNATEISVFFSFFSITNDKKKV